MAKTTKDAKTLATAKVLAEAVEQSTTLDATKETKPATPASTVTINDATNEAINDVTKDASADKPVATDKPRAAWQADDWRISNQTPSMMAFPELGQQAAAMLKPYTKDVPVRFQTAAMFDQFHANLAQLRTLCGWNEVRGVFVYAHEETTGETTEEIT